MMSELPNYINTLNALKEKIRQARIRASVSVNVELLKLNWEIGNTILDQQKTEGWGSKVIDTLATDLRTEFPDFKGLSVRNLKYMRAFAEAYPSFNTIVQPVAAQIQNTDSQQGKFAQAPLAQIENTAENEIVQVPLAQLSWYHHITLLDKVKDTETRLFYIQETAQNGWSRDVMVHQIEGGLHNRKGKVLSNFKNTIAPEQSELVQQLFKDPYKFDFIYLGKEAKERDLEDALTNQITKVLLELGQYFSFMGRQYKITLDEKEYFFDLLFYHTRLKRYIVIELKIDDFKPEYKGKMDFYLNLADENLKDKGDAETIGLILCKTKNGLVAEYALRDSSKPIGIAEYKIRELLPENIRGEMPSIEELEAEIEKEYEELKSPAQNKFDMLKEKIFRLKGEEIKQTATTPILFDIIDKSIIPLYEAIVKRMEDFKQWFYSCSISCTGANANIENISQLAEQWKNEQFLKSNYSLSFYYRLDGLIRAGTKGALVAGFELNFQKEKYWYGFILPNYNNSHPIIKKLYHEQLSQKEIADIVDIVYSLVTDEMDRAIERLNEK